ncbi:hypothetical protein AAFC00_006243 [Neodothiora populina]|uniref:Amino-acid transporter arg-13 n=1 Tax=Neodothiora populina TaxID=2781224 RepID=A0ABR3P4V0_9PEZI
MDVREAHPVAGADVLAIRDGKKVITAPSSSSEKAHDALKDIVFGSTAGVAGKFVEYPFDTVKVRLQSQPDHLPLRYTGPIDCFRQSLRHDGVLGIYRGISAPLVGAAVETSSLFFSYRLAQNALRMTLYPSTESLPLGALVACGAASGAFTSLLLTPIELIKCKMQVPADSNRRMVARPGPVQLIASVYRHHGLAGFWHGQMGTLLRETGGSAAWFGAYEAISAAFLKLREPIHGVATGKQEKQEPLHFYQQMIAGAAAGVSYNFLFYPADTIKSRMQTEEVSEMVGRQRKTFWSAGRALWHQHGIKGMYRGCGITCFRSAPSSALIFAIYEWLKRTFD